MVTNQEPVKQNHNVKRTRVHEGPRNHFIAFGVSIFLTLLAFLAVYHTGLSRSFTYFFIILLAIVQVVFQLTFWMHLKDKGRGHIYAVIGLSFGAIIGLCMFAAALFWSWW